MKEHLISSVGLVITQGSRVVLVRQDERANHPKGMYGLPSRRNRENESDIDAAKRTLSDETGLTATEFTEFANNYFEAEVEQKNGGTEKFAWRVFRVNNFSGELNGNEEVTPEWFNLKDLNEMESQNILLPNTINAINASMK